MELVEQAPEGVIGVGSRVRVSPKLEHEKISPDSVGVVREVHACVPLSSVVASPCCICVCVCFPTMGAAVDAQPADGRGLFFLLT
jgi:hypothetical protein